MHQFYPRCNGSERSVETHIYNKLANAYTVTPWVFAATALSSYGVCDWWILWLVLWDRWSLSSELIYTASYRITAHTGPVNMWETVIFTSAESIMMTINGVCTAFIKSSDSTVTCIWQQGWFETLDSAKKKKKTLVVFHSRIEIVGVIIKGWPCWGCQYFNLLLLALYCSQRLFKVSFFSDIQRYSLCFNTLDCENHKDKSSLIRV